MEHWSRILFFGLGSLLQLVHYAAMVRKSISRRRAEQEEDARYKRTLFGGGEVPKMAEERFVRNVKNSAPVLATYIQCLPEHRGDGPGI